jgi:hypothetical protein
MDCEEYREAILADPSEAFADGREHAAECPACSDFRAEARTLDDCIGRALAIDVPELAMPELPAAGGAWERNAARLPVRRSRLSGIPAWLGLAAGVAVALVLATRGWSPEDKYPPLAEQVLAHMDYEQASRQVTTVAVSERALGSVLDAKVSSLDTGGGIVSYATSCVIGGNTVPHLVVQGRSGPVTLILLPDERIDAAIPLEGEHVHGVILPVGDGSIAVIGEREDQLREVEEIGERVVDSVKWII